MSERIGQLWELGETQFKGGDALEALLNFQRAKTLLISESNSIYSNPSLANGKASKLMGEIMQKLTSSIERASFMLHKNPIMALNLTRGFTKADVKKAYRKCALKYHPDKNQDCDSSCIFTAVQAAYEKLEATAPTEAPSGSSSSHYASGMATAAAMAAPSYASAFAPRAAPKGSNPHDYHNNIYSTGNHHRTPEQESAARTAAAEAAAGVPHGYVFKTRDDRKQQPQQPQPPNQSSTNNTTKQSSSSSGSSRYREGEMKSKTDRDRSNVGAAPNPAANAEDRFFELSTDMLKGLLKEFGVRFCSCSCPILQQFGPVKRCSTAVIFLYECYQQLILSPSLHLLHIRSSCHVSIHDLSNMMYET